MRAMSTRVWDQAAHLPVPADSTPRAEIVALPLELPRVEALFTFMRDAELRFQTLRMRISSSAVAAGGERVTAIEVMLRHPGRARVTTTQPERSAAGNYDLWLSDGEFVQTFSGIHRVGTRRPVRPRPRLTSPDLPGMSTVYTPLTALPMETLPETFVHPAGFCQNVLATGECRVAGTAEQAGREAIVLECDHPRTVEVTADRRDHRIQVTVDRETGVITRLIELLGDTVTRDAEVTSLEPDAPLPPGAFEFAIPSDATLLY